MKALMQRARLAGRLLQTQGPGWLAYRVGHAVRLRAGLVRRRLPAGSWDDRPLAMFLRDPASARPESYFESRREHAPAFFFTAADRGPSAERLRAWDQGREGPVEVADRLGHGVLRYFEHIDAAAGYPPDWHANPLTGTRAPADRHWSLIGDFDQGDIKVIWEPSRFAFAFTLVRAYWRTGDETYAERFWELVESWRVHNPPQTGANWKCGQEVALRVAAWCFGLYGFLQSPATTPARVAALAQMVAVSGDRIDALLDFALSQNNNHGVSEAIGLWTIGLLFPEFAAAGRWRERGRRTLEDLGRSLIYDDGGFSQHSFNYQRVMLHDYLWAVRLGDLHGQPLSAVLRQRVGRSGELLYQLQDESGRVPNHGANDGALILPLSNCDSRDFRPVVQATHYLASKTRRLGEGPWDEDLFWLFGAGALEAPVAAPGRWDLRSEAGGYHSLRSEHGFAFMRCATFRHRPGHADLLHVDLWWRGQNVAIDPGTYSYNAPPPWDNTLARTAHHNTVSVDGLDQMDRVGRFLWLPWARGRLIDRIDSPGGSLAYWAGEHDGYQRLPDAVAHRRAVLRLPDEHWLVLDRLQGRSSEHDYRLHWLLADFPYAWELPGQGTSPARLELQTNAGPYSLRCGCIEGPVEASLVRADEESPRGWQSLDYLGRTPALSLAVRRRAVSAWFWTAMGPGLVEVEVSAAGRGVEVVGPGWRARVKFGEIGTQGLVAEVERAGAARDRLEVSR